MVGVFGKMILLSEAINLFTDASGAFGFGAFFHGHWCAEPCHESWVADGLTRNRVFLELFPMVVVVWGNSFKDNSILLNADNIGMMFLIN